MLLPPVLLLLLFHLLLRLLLHMLLLAIEALCLTCSSFTRARS
jgi:hypothetical protein